MWPMFAPAITGPAVPALEHLPSGRSRSGRLRKYASALACEPLRIDVHKLRAFELRFEAERYRAVEYGLAR